MAEYQYEIMKDPTGYMTPEQVNLVIKKTKNLKHKVLILLLYRSGRRISEVLELKVKDVLFDLESINFPILKKNHRKDKRLKKQEAPRRIKPMDPETMETLRQYISVFDKNKNDWLFSFDHSVNPEDKPTRLTRFGAYYIVRNSFEKVGITQIGNKKPHPHHLRHSFAIEYAQHSETPFDLVQLKKHLEHSSIEMTMSYLQFHSDKKFRDTLGKMFKK